MTLEPMHGSISTRGKSTKKARKAQNNAKRDFNPILADFRSMKFQPHFSKSVHLLERGAKGELC